MRQSALFDPSNCGQREFQSRFWIKSLMNIYTFCGVWGMTHIVYWVIDDQLNGFFAFGMQNKKTGKVGFPCLYRFRGLFRTHQEALELRPRRALSSS